MDVIIDMQFVKNDKNVVVPKEVAFLSVDGNYAAHWIVAPSNNLEKCDREVRLQNNWLKRNFHGLDHFEGDVSLRSLYKTIKEVAKKFNRVFVRGNEKLSVLQKLTSVEIGNLEYDSDCPSFHNLPWSDAYCIHHAVKILHLHFACALNNVHRLKNWLQTQEKYQVLSSLSELPLIQLNDEQPRDFEKAVEDNRPFRGCFSSRPESESLDETDSYCSQHG